MLITCVMRHARLQKLQRFRRKMPFYSFLILWHCSKKFACLCNLFAYEYADRYFKLTSFEINAVSKETNRAEPEYMNIHTPINALKTALYLSHLQDPDKGNFQCRRVCVLKSKFKMTCSKKFYCQNKK